MFIIQSFKLMNSPKWMPTTKRETSVRMSSIIGKRFAYHKIYILQYNMSITSSIGSHCIAAVYPSRFQSSFYLFSSTVSFLFIWPDCLVGELMLARFSRLILGYAMF